MRFIYLYVNQCLTLNVLLPSPDGRREMLQWYADYMEALEKDENVVHGRFGKRV